MRRSYSRVLIFAIVFTGLISCGGGDISSTGTNPGNGGGLGGGANTQSLTLNWTPPTLNTDNSDLKDLVNYKLYYGTVSTTLDQSVLIGAQASSYTLNNLPDNTTYYFAITAININNGESDRSNVVMKTTPS